MTRKLNRAIGLVVLASVAAAAVTGVAIATSGSGVSGTVVARGLATDKVKTRGNQPYDVVVQKLAVAPGGHTGWHTHPGIAVAVVKAGTLTIYDGDDASCSPRTFHAGDTYVDPGYGHVHIGRNEGTVPLEIVVTYLDVPAGGGVRIDAPSPGNCPF
jgi:quercetin dioxygenase-like cupin family protein